MDLLEQRYPEHPGLNLSFELREGIAKHETSVKLDLAEFDPSTRPTLEASLVDIADEIAYNAHDIDDGLSAGILGLEGLCELSIWNHPPGERFDRGGQFGHLVDDQKRHLLVRHLVNLMATDVLEETERRLERLGIRTLEQLRHAPERVCDYSSVIDGPVRELKEFLKVKLYRHPRLIDMTQWAREILVTLYGHFSSHPELLPARFQEMLLTERKEIVIADYIAGMTDRFAEKIYAEVG